MVIRGERAAGITGTNQLSVAEEVGYGVSKRVRCRNQVAGAVVKIRP